MSGGVGGTLRLVDLLKRLPGPFPSSAAQYSENIKVSLKPTDLFRGRLKTCT